MSDLDLELGNRFHGDVLGSFQCCMCGATSASAGRLSCGEPWAHEVQDHIQQDALPHALSSSRWDLDHRLWLAFEGSDVVAVGAHQQRPDVSAASRYLPFIAVRIDRRGSAAPAAGYADAMLEHLIADARTRSPAPSDMQARIDPRNVLSIRFFLRHGFRVGNDPVMGYLPAALPLIT